MGEGGGGGGNGGGYGRGPGASGGPERELASPPPPLAPQEFSEVFPHLLTATDVPRLCKIEDVAWAAVDAVFCCLPHATTQEVLLGLPGHVKVVDLSADFRLRDVASYAEWCEFEAAAAGKKGERGE